MYSQVNQEKCIACGLCQIKAPDLFDYDTAGIAQFKLDHNQGTAEIPEKYQSQFKDAYIHCPTGAIMRSENPLNQP